MVHIPHRDKQVFANKLKQIWLAPDAETARKRTAALAEEYEKRFPQAVRTLEDGLEDSRQFFSYPL
jgi:transposase-like protein